MGKLQKTFKRYNLDDLPAEIVDHIFSFLLVSECETVLDALKGPETVVGNIAKRNIYGRSVLCVNNRQSGLMGTNAMTKLLFKYIDDNEKLSQLTQEAAVIPNRFVLSYNYNRFPKESSSDLSDCYLSDFESTFQALKHRYFKNCQMIEVCVDLFNKKTDSNETAIVNRLLAEPEIRHNLTYLNLNRFQRLEPALIQDLCSTLAQNLHHFNHLHTLTLSSNNIQDISDWKFPSSLLHLNLLNNKLSELPKNRQFLPPKLIKLNLACNNLRNLDEVQFPESLEYLDLQLNNVSKLSSVPLPQDLKVLIASGNNIMFDQNESIYFPESLVYLNLLQNPYLNNLHALNLGKSLRHIYVDATIQDKRSSDVITYM